jgi:dienelactone hydrolase
VARLQEAPVLESTVELKAADGPMPVFVVHPERYGPHPVALVLMDGLGMRETPAVARDLPRAELQR